MWKAQLRCRCSITEVSTFVSIRCFVLGFEHLQALYAEDEDFGELFAECSKHPKGDFIVQ